MAQRTLSTKPTDTENRLVAFVKGTDWAFQTAMRPESFLKFRKICEAVSLLGALRYTLDLWQACITDLCLGRLWRLVSLKLKTEIICSVKMNHPSEGTAFRSVSTYLLNNNSGSPSSIP